MSTDRPGRSAATSDPRASVVPGASPGRASVIVVDGDRAELDRIGRVLGDAGHPVIATTNGRAALRRVFESSTGPGLLICEIEMPEMSGIELAARVSAARPGVRVLLMSSDPRSVERARDRDALVRGVLLKPFSADRLRVAVTDALDDLR